ncbi:hypothetical protein PSECIP111854_04114 [Pseudoalteromonas sp. CIP111854]|uniref:Uncharacterized protein n=1 Tax=Pseudoalteromonas holothuriae TaxID=2963714 RepID=A0A9W4VW04_9GAMM|nr:hypothetical protein [Pseudoalteromonas sp. CIP111854]CAH9067470.1 hypothetical protein PSECIP111854_04114 [Pseudoalteromonas sp. CIP111854]
MRKLILLVGMLSAATQAGVIKQVEVNNNTVLFSTTSIADSNLPCTSVDNKKLRAFSLNTHDGRAMYSLIVTALSKNYAIETVSAQDCADTHGAERAKTVRLLANTNKEVNTSGSIGVYKSDGISRVGSFIKLDKSEKVAGEQYIWTYIDGDAAADYKTIIVEPHFSTEIFYSEYGCKGEELVKRNTSWFNNGKHFQTDTSRNEKIKSSRRKGSACTHNVDYLNYSGWPAKEIEHPVCGNGLCTIRED